jgi:hypothetical protein
MANDNRDNVLRLIYDGRTQTVKEWATELGIPPSTLYTRINRYGMSAKEAIDGILMGKDGKGRIKYVPHKRNNKTRKRRGPYKAERLVGAIQMLVGSQLSDSQFREAVKEVLRKEGYG